MKILVDEMPKCERECHFSQISGSDSTGVLYRCMLVDRHNLCNLKYGICPYLTAQQRQQDKGDDLR